MVQDKATILQNIKDWFSEREEIWCDKWDDEIVAVYTYSDYEEKLKEDVGYYINNGNDFTNYVDYAKFIFDKYNLPLRRLTIVFRNPEGKLYELFDIDEDYPQWKDDYYNFYLNVFTTELFIVENYNVRDCCD